MKFPNRGIAVADDNGDTIEMMEVVPAPLPPPPPLPQKQVVMKFAADSVVAPATSDRPPEIVQSLEYGNASGGAKSEHLRR